LDVYSRPVLIEGKKLWEVLITSDDGRMRYVKPLESSAVNSKAVREAVEECIEEVGEMGGDCKVREGGSGNDGHKAMCCCLPTYCVLHAAFLHNKLTLLQRHSPPLLFPLLSQEVRFFRGQMFNMINIAMSSIDVVTKPSRATYSLLSWLADREDTVYPEMEGYKASMSQKATSGSGQAFLDIRTPIKLPDALRGERYAFVSLPLSEFKDGGGVNKDNIGAGRMCPVPEGLPDDEFVMGVVVMTQRAKALTAWMAGTEVCGISCDLRRRQMVMEADISTQYLVAKLDEGQRKEGVAFEQGKERMGGLHFLCVQEDEEDEEPKGVWLLREVETK